MNESVVSCASLAPRDRRPLAGAAGLLIFRQRAYLWTWEPARPAWSSFEEVQPIPPSWDGIVWHHAGNHYDHPRHRHVALELNLIVGGRGHYEVGGHTHALSAGTALFIAPGKDHYLEERTPDFEMWILALKPALLERTCAGAAGAAFLRAVDAGDCARLLSVDDARWLGREIRRFADTGSPDSCTRALPTR